LKRPGPLGYEHRKEPPGHQKFTSVVPDYGPILVFGKVVQVDPLTADRCGKTVAFVKVGDTEVNEKLLRQGLARVFSRYLRPADRRAVG
jgi:hypothetical protein